MLLSFFPPVENRHDEGDEVNLVPFNLTTLDTFCRTVPTESYGYMKNMRCTLLNRV